jgi:DNA-directed RNA polymerase subunit RPC12/RpoP
MSIMLDEANAYESSRDYDCSEGGKRMSKTIRYVECAHCGEAVGTYYVTCPYCGYRLAVHSQPPSEKCTD